MKEGVIPKECYDGQHVQVMSAFGDKRLILMVMVKLENNYFQGNVHVGVVENLPVSCLVGNDIRRRISSPNLKLESITEVEESLEEESYVVETLVEWEVKDHNVELKSVVEEKVKQKMIELSNETISVTDAEEFKMRVKEDMSLQIYWWKAKEKMELECNKPKFIV